MIHCLLLIPDIQFITVLYTVVGFYLNIFFLCFTSLISIFEVAVVMCGGWIIKTVLKILGVCVYNISVRENWWRGG